MGRTNQILAARKGLPLIQINKTRRLERKSFPSARQVLPENRAIFTFYNTWSYLSGVVKLFSLSWS